MRNKHLSNRQKLKRVLEIVGFILLVAVIVNNLIIARNFYYLDKLKVPQFFFLQANKNELFDPAKRY